MKFIRLLLLFIIVLTPITLVAQPKEVVDAYNLQKAIRKGNVSELKKLIKGGSDVNIQYNGQNALHTACEIGSINMTELIIKAGADVNSLTEEGKGLTSLQWISWGFGFKRSPQILELLLKNGADPNIARNNYNYPLYYALENKDVEIASLLLAHGAKRDIKNSKGQTPLGYARKEASKASLSASDRKAYQNIIQLLEKPKQSAVASKKHTQARPQNASSQSAKHLGKADGSVRMALILDASGSMWGQINGTPKIQIAKSAMYDLIDSLSADMHVGLFAYGHRRKGDCNDIEMLMPAAKLNTDLMKKKIKAINPKGKTPLSASVLKAAKTLDYLGKRSSVVLVSDGLETCDIDPCKLAMELSTKGKDFTIHVIGFDISKGEQARLRCMADKTGGMFLAAKDADTLRHALFTTIKEVKAPPPPLVNDPGKAMLTGPSSIPAGATFTVKWKGPDSRGDYIAIAQKGSGEISAEDLFHTKSGNPAKLVAPGEPGKYELRYVYDHTSKIIGRSLINVTSVKASVRAPSSADAATSIDVSWKGPGYPGDFVSIARPDQHPGAYVKMAWPADGNPLAVIVPSEPGTYEIRYILGEGEKLLAKASLTVKGVTANIQAPKSAPKDTTLSVKWQGPGHESDYITIARLDQHSGSYVNMAWVADGNPAKLQAPSEPGTYEVRYILGEGDKLLAKTPITINAN